MGFTLWGMALLPTSPALSFWVKYASDTYCPRSTAQVEHDRVHLHRAWWVAATHRSVHFVVGG